MIPMYNDPSVHYTRPSFPPCRPCPDRVHVGNIPPTVTEAELRQVFDGFNFQNYRIKIKVTNKETNYGFVYLNNEAEAEQIIQFSAHGEGLLSVRGRTLRISRAFERQPPYGTLRHHSARRRFTHEGEMQQQPEAQHNGETLIGSPDQGYIDHQTAGAVYAFTAGIQPHEHQHNPVFYPSHYPNYHAQFICPNPPHTGLSWYPGSTTFTHHTDPQSFPIHNNFEPLTIQSCGDSTKMTPTHSPPLEYSSHMNNFNPPVFIESCYLSPLSSPGGPNSSSGYTFDPSLQPPAPFVVEGFQKS